MVKVTETGTGEKIDLKPNTTYLMSDEKCSIKVSTNETCSCVYIEKGLIMAIMRGCESVQSIDGLVQFVTFKELQDD